MNPYDRDCLYPGVYAIERRNNVDTDCQIALSMQISELLCTNQSTLVDAGSITHGPISIRT